MLQDSKGKWTLTSGFVVDGREIVSAYDQFDPVSKRSENVTTLHAGDVVDLGDFHAVPSEVS
jgi:hypothetical protein